VLLPNEDWLSAIGYWLLAIPDVITFHVLRSTRVTRHPSPSTHRTLKIPSISKVFKAFQRKSFYAQEGGGRAFQTFQPN
jgi:hypothetical protein